MKILTLITACIALAGCAASSVDGLKQSAAPQEFTTASNYQEVYRNIAANARACWSGGFLLSPQAQRIVDADLYAELGKGEVTMWMSNLGTSVYAHALIERRAPAETHVSVWNHPNWGQVVPAMETWASGQRTCD